MTQAIVALMLACLVLLNGGCTTTIIPPPHPAVPTTVYVTNYGRHSSVVVPDAQGHYVEFAFGDWGWFGRGQKNSSTGLHAMLLSNASALGRREIVLPPGASDSDVARTIGAQAVMHVEVSHDRAESLLHELNAIHQSHIDTVTFNSKTHLWFVKYQGNYGLCHNCNHATAHWLKELDCKIQGTAMFSKFRITP